MRGRVQNYHDSQQSVLNYMFENQCPSKPTAHQLIDAARQRITQGETPQEILYKLQVVINLRTEVFDDWHKQNSHIVAHVDHELERSSKGHRMWLACLLQVRKILDPPKSGTKAETKAETKPRTYHTLNSSSSDELDAPDHEVNEEVQPEPIAEVNPLWKDTPDGPADDEILFQLCLHDISDLISLVLECMREMLEGTVNIPASQLVIETAWKYIQSSLADISLTAERVLAQGFRRRWQIKKLKGIPSAKRIAEELVKNEISSKEASDIKEALQLIPAHSTVVPPVFHSIYTCLRDLQQPKPPNSTRLTLYIAILLVKDAADIWTDGARHDLRTSLLQTKDRVEALAGRANHIIPRPGEANIPSEGLSTHKLLNLVQSWQSIPRNLHPWWCSFWIMTILTPITPLCIPFAADPLVVELLIGYPIFSHQNIRNPTVESFCKATSTLFPNGVPASLDELGDLYNNLVTSPTANRRAKRKMNSNGVSLSQGYGVADALISRMFHIGPELLKLLRDIAEERKGREDYINDCDILGALKTQLVKHLDSVPNFIDLSYTLHSVERNSNIASAEEMKIFLDKFNYHWTGFSRTICAPKLGESMFFSWEEFLKTDKPTFSNLFAIAKCVSVEILKSTQSSQKRPSVNHSPPSTRTLWKMLIVTTSGSVYNLPSYIEDLQALTENSPVLMAGTILDFLKAICSYLFPNSTQLHAILKRAEDHFKKQPHGVELVERLVSEVEKARQDVGEYMKSHPARNLAIASIGFLEKSLKDGSADRDHIQTAIERISRCFKIEDRDSSEEVNLLAIFTDYEKQRTAVFKSQGNSHMKIHLFHEAIESYTKALELDPYNPILLRNRSVAYTKIASKEKARTDAENAVAMDPHFAPAWSQLGYIRYWIGDPWGSMEAYQTAINLCGGSEKDKKGLEKASAFCARVAGPDSNFGAGQISVPRSGGTSSQLDGVHVAIELPIGFDWYKKSTCGGRLVNRIPREGCIMIRCKPSSPKCRYFYTEYMESRDIVHNFLTWLSFSQPIHLEKVASFEFDTSQSILGTDHQGRSRIVEEIIASSVISRDCSVLLSSRRPPKLKPIPKDGSQVFGLSRVFRDMGIELEKNGHYDDALEYFYSAVSALDQINPPISLLLLESVEVRSLVLQTYFKIERYDEIEEKFVSDTYTLATVPANQSLQLSSDQQIKLKNCILLCAKIHLEWDNLSRTSAFSKECIKLYGPYIPARELISTVEEMLASRKLQGHFPRLKSLEYGTTSQETVGSSCSICSCYFEIGGKFDRIKACSHSFHHHCLSQRLSKEFFNEAQGIARGKKADPDLLKCPQCEGKIDYSSIQQGHFAEWLANDPFQPEAGGGTEERVYVVE